MQELAEQIANTQLEIVATEETRLSGNGLNKRNKYSQNYRGSNKIGFIVMKKALKYILGFEPYNEGMCKLKIKGKNNNITLIKLYTPTEDKIDEDKKTIL